MPGLLNIMRAWGPDTCHKEDDYTEKDRARGQCVPTALLVQDLLGGDIAMCKVGRQRHYYNVNLPKEKAPYGYIDLTAHQYGWDFHSYPREETLIPRRQLLRQAGVRRRYVRLAQRAGFTPKEA